MVHSGRKPARKTTADSENSDVTKASVDSVGVRCNTEVHNLCNDVMEHLRGNNFCIGGYTG